MKELDIGNKKYADLIRRFIQAEDLLKEAGIQLCEASAMKTGTPRRSSTAQIRNNNLRGIEVAHSVDDVMQTVWDVTQTVDDVTQTIDDVTQTIDDVTQSVDDVTQTIDNVIQIVHGVTKIVDDDEEPGPNEDEMMYCRLQREVTHCRNEFEV